MTAYAGAVRQRSCAFCRNPPVGTYAVTALRGDAEDASAWGRGTLPLCRREPAFIQALTSCRGDPANPANWHQGVLAVCKRCQAALEVGGAEGRKLKGRDVRWFVGHDAAPITPA